VSKNPESSIPDQTKETIGEVLPKDSLFLSIAVGSAKVAKNGRELDLSTDMNHQPMITDKKTGKTWVITWGEMISLAVISGVTED